ncbi:hypothetical protein [Pseudomonas sp. NFACC02]|uniref:hypothetical protein n=1 Tax=Pseudomonas sp. NFACC02 TaxID=1566250 RepID=UPI00111362BF|nr:hypothetical protein [Pseudomonas sp. NFACC02]
MDEFIHTGSKMTHASECDGKRDDQHQQNGHVDGHRKILVRVVNVAMIPVCGHKMNGVLSYVGYRYKQ